MRRTTPVRPVLLLAALVLATPLASAQGAAAAPAPSTGTWTAAATVPETSGEAVRTVRPVRFQRWTLDRSAFDRALPRDRAAGTSSVITLPAPDGRLQRFAVLPSEVMEAGLAAAHPEISTWAGRGLDDPAASVAVDVGSLGLHASVRSPAGAWYVDPYYSRDRGVYLSYRGSDLTTSPHGTFVERDGSGLAAAEGALGSAAPDVTAAPGATGTPDGRAAGPSLGNVLRTYRLALVSDPSYATYFGFANVTAAKVALMNRVDQIYENDLSIRMVLVNATDKLNLGTDALASGTNGPCGSAPCFYPHSLSSCTIQALTRNSFVLGRLVGAGAYDIGHIALGTNGGGIAGLGVVGGPEKAIGCTGIPTPVGDFYAVDYVAHEMGHEFGGNHPFNGVEVNCSGGNRNGPTSVEPGSGSSIMAYAGICGHDDLQPHSDPYFSERSQTEISAYTRYVQPAVDEVQTVGLTGFQSSDSFALTFRGATTATIVRGRNYTAAGITRALTALPTVPATASIAVTGFGGAGNQVDDTGFQVFFAGALGGVDVPALGLTAEKGLTGSVGESRHGGPDRNRGAVSRTGNNAPVVTAPTRHVIPLRTPFSLTGSATDVNGDVLTYLWEQDDAGGAVGTGLIDPKKQNGPLFREFGVPLDPSVYRPGTYGSPGENAATTDPSRTFPNLLQVLSGNTNALTGDCTGPRPGSATDPVSARLVDCYSEFLPTAAWRGVDGQATLHFRLTARDDRQGGGGVASADTTVQLARTDGPFLVTSQPGGQSYAPGSGQQVRWDVAGTAAAPVGTARVRITMSRNGGRTWPVVLAAAAPNTGSAQVTIPAGATGAARIRIEAVGNIFFAVNAAPFAVTG